MTSLDLTSAGFRCAICHDEYPCLAGRLRQLGCGHAFGARCLADWVARADKGRDPSCPLCRRPLGQVEMALVLGAGALAAADDSEDD